MAKTIDADRAGRALRDFISAQNQIQKRMLKMKKADQAEFAKDLSSALDAAKFMVSYDQDSDLVVKASNLAGEIMEQAAKNGIVIPEAADRFKDYSDGYRLCCHIRKDQQGAEGEALMNRILTPGNPEYEFSARRAAIILTYVRDGKAIPDPLINPEYKDEAVEKAYKRGYYENYDDFAEAVTSLGEEKEPAL